MDKTIIKRLEEYIEYAKATNRIADVVFYGEVIAAIEQLQADKAGINTTAEDALAFYDDVRGASVEEKIAVGTDHYDYILKTLRLIATYTGSQQ